MRSVSRSVRRVTVAACDAIPGNGDAGVVSVALADTGDRDDPPDDPGTATTRRARGAQRLEAARTRTRERVSALEERRPHSPLIDAGFRLGETNRAVGGAVLAGAVAFRLFVFLVPFVFTFIVSLGIYGGYASPQEAADAGGVGGLAATAVDDAAAASNGFQWTAVAAGVLATLWAGYGLARVLRIVHGLSWRCVLPPMRRPLLLPVGPVVFALGVMAITRILKMARDHLGIVGAAITVGGFVAYGALWLVVSHLLPRKEGSGWVDLLPGSVLVAVGTQVLHLATIWYFAARIDGLSDRYGALGTALGILSWAYLAGWLFSMSGVLNAVVFEVRGPRGGGNDDVTLPDSLAG